MVIHNACSSKLFFGRRIVAAKPVGKQVVRDYSGTGIVASLPCRPTKETPCGLSRRTRIMIEISILPSVLAAYE
jgi:hypothetical protein